LVARHKAYRTGWVIGILTLVTLWSGIAIGQKVTPQKPTDKLAIAEDEVKQLLLLMDTDKNGKISKHEYMNFMAAEFDRLDKDKSGELDPKELTQSQLRVSHFTHVGK
jgi:Ca2+-binding EF-hand superfamily protein